MKTISSVQLLVHPGMIEGISSALNLKQNKTKTTALRIPAWSPTVVLTERHSG